MKKLIKYNILLIAFVTGMSSCTEKIDLALDSGQTKLVVYGEITTDTTSHEVFLSYSSDYLDDSPATGVEGASVELSFDDSLIVLEESQPGTYITPANFFGTEGMTYNLRISDLDINNDGENEEYSATTELVSVASLDSIGLVYTSDAFFSGWEIQIYAWDPEGIKNYYLFKSIKNGVLQTDSLYEFVFQNDDFFDGNYTYGISAQFLDDAKKSEKAIPGDTITFEMNGINEEYYDFLIEAQTESFGSNPLFSGPPANIKSNITNDALGFFTAYSVERMSLIVPQYPEED